MIYNFPLYSQMQKIFARNTANPSPKSLPWPRIRKGTNYIMSSIRPRTGPQLLKNFKSIGQEARYNYMDESLNMSSLLLWTSHHISTSQSVMYIVAYLFFPFFRPLWWEICSRSRRLSGHPKDCKRTSNNMERMYIYDYLCCGLSIKRCYCIIFIFACVTMAIVWIW